MNTVKPFPTTYPSRQLIKDILQLLKPYRFRFWLASFIRLIGDLAWLYPALAFATIVTFLTQYKPGQSLNTVWITLGLWLGATAIRSLSQFYAKYLGYQVAEQLGIDAALNTVRHLFKLDMGWHERENSGNKLKRIQNASQGLNDILRLWFNSLIEIVVNLIAINIIIAQFDHTVLLVLVIFLVTYFVISAIMTRRAGKASLAVNQQEEVVNGLVFEALNNIRTVKVMAMAKAVLIIITQDTTRLFNRLGKRIFWFQSRYAFLSFWAILFKLGIFAIIILGILHGQYTLAFLILFNSYFSDLRESIDELSTATQDFVTAKYSIARMKEILDEPIRIDHDTQTKVLVPDWQAITFNNVSFAYGENIVLKNLSFEIKRGEKVGIVGLSGAGKSTLFKLLLKERDEFTGTICFDDTSLTDITSSEYFKHTSVVLQDTEVFNFSLRDNITITNQAQATDPALLQQALDIAHISDFVGKLPQGLDTIIGEKGVKLSGGERQRLGIARAIFKQPELLLLDEATSHLDLESEETIRDSLHKFFQNITAIVIAHRLTTIREMDKILVLDGGKIIESGNFEELYAQKEKFYDLWEKQKL